MSKNNVLSPLLIGTSGFSYDDWVGPFYPPGLPRSEWFEFYASQFRCLEINSSYYSFLSPKTVRSLVDRAPVGFRFAIKLHQSLTHERKDLAKAIQQTQQQNQLFQESRMLATQLAQFPHSFSPSPQAWHYLHQLAENLSPLCIEFRNARWQNEETVQRLREWGVSFCVVDQPELPGLMKFKPIVTHPPAYVRFHGRNAKMWYSHQEAWERYNYLYTEEELRQRCDDIKTMANQAGEVLIFFNNHYQAQAVVNARQLIGLLKHSTD